MSALPPSVPQAPQTQHAISIGTRISVQLDRLIADYAASGERFTVCEWRDRLIKRPELAHFCPKSLRYRIRDRIKALKQQGLAHQVDFQGKRRPVFVLEPAACPNDHVPASGDPETQASVDAAHPASALPFAEFLNQECHRLKLDMQAALGEASHYAYILQQYPDQRAVIEPLHQAACQRGSEAKGALDAVVTLRQQIGEEATS